MIKIETLDRIIRNDTPPLIVDVINRIVEVLKNNRTNYLYIIDFCEETYGMDKNSTDYKERKQIITKNQKILNNIISLNQRIFCSDSCIELSIKKFICMSYDDIMSDALLKDYINNHGLYDLGSEDLKQFEKYNKNQKDISSSKSLWGRIFDYDNISRREIKKGLTFRNYLMNLINLDVCPYCNRLYITKWKDSSGNFKSTADLDHFFIKKDYPIFALSFFNFIPSCSVCNSRMKGDCFLSKDKHHTPPLYPGKAGFGNEAYFSVEKSAKDILDFIFEKKDLEIDFTVNSSNYEKEIKQSIELFHLKEVYNSHKKYVKDILLKQYAFDNDSYTDMLRCLINDINTLKNARGNNSKIYNSNDNMNVSLKKEIQEFIFGYNWDDDDKCDANRPLSKLTYDILNR